MPLQETLQFEIRLFPEKKQTIPYDYSDQTTRRPWNVRPSRLFFMLLDNPISWESLFVIWNLARVTKFYGR